MTNLVGVWHLVEWERNLDGVYHSHPFGREAQGRLIYTADGYVSAFLMRPDRPAFSQPYLTKGTDEELRMAVEGFVSYSGTYTLQDDVVSHQVALTLLPNWVGIDLVREVSWIGLEKQELQLSTWPEMTSSGQVVVSRLHWQREPR